MEQGMTAISGGAGFFFVVAFIAFFVAIAIHLLRLYSVGEVVGVVHSTSHGDIFSWGGGPAEIGVYRERMRGGGEPRVKWRCGRRGVPVAVDRGTAMAMADALEAAACSTRPSTLFATERFEIEATPPRGTIHGVAIVLLGDDGWRVAYPVVAGEARRLAELLRLAFAPGRNVAEARWHRKRQREPVSPG
jgi:hypothetical protein